MAQLGNIFENYFLLNSSQHPPNALFRHLLHLIESEKKTFTLIFIWTNPPVVFFILKPQEKISQIHSIFWLQFLLDIWLFIPVLMFGLRLPPPQLPVYNVMYIILATSPRYAAIGYFRPKKKKKIQIFFCLKPSPGQDRTNKKRIIQIGPYVPKEIGPKHCYIHPSAIYKEYIYRCNFREREF